MADGSDRIIMRIGPGATATTESTATLGPWPLRLGLPYGVEARDVRAQADHDPALHP